MPNPGGAPGVGQGPAQAAAAPVHRQEENNKSMIKEITEQGAFAKRWEHLYEKGNANEAAFTRIADLHENFTAFG